MLFHIFRKETRLRACFAILLQCLFSRAAIGVCRRGCLMLGISSSQVQAQDGDLDVELA